MLRDVRCILEETVFAKGAQADVFPLAKSNPKTDVGTCLTRTADNWCAQASADLLCIVALLIV